MIERDKDDDIFEISCDYCGPGHLSIDASPGWGAMIARMKSAGWSIRKIGEEFKHMCPGCADEGKRW